MLIGVTGHKGSGKDTFAGASGFSNLKMAAPLKNMLRSLWMDAGLDHDEIERRIEGDLKEEVCPVLGTTPRWAMQSLGHEWRNMIREDLWSRIWVFGAQSMLAEGLPVICTDVRYFHEAESVRALGGRMVRVVRPGLEVDLSHKSERDIPLIEVDLEVINDGSVEDLELKAYQFIKEISQ